MHSGRVAGEQTSSSSIYLEVRNHVLWSGPVQRTSPRLWYKPALVLYLPCILPPKEVHRSGGDPTKDAWVASFVVGFYQCISLSLHTWDKSFKT